MKKSALWLPTLCCALLIGCSTEAPSASVGTASSDSATVKPAAGNTTEAKYALMQKLRPFKTDRRVYENPQVVAAQEATSQAQRQWVEARDAHPALAPLVEKAKSLMSQAVAEGTGGDNTAAKRLAAEAGAAKAELEQAGLRLPDLAAQNEARQAASRAVERAEIEALKTIPEARELAEQWQALLDAN